MKAVVLYMLLGASSGYAADSDCANALSASPVTSQFAQSYIELIAHYRKNSTEEESVSMILKAIINSNHILNPLLNWETDSRFRNSLPIRISQAIEKLIPSLSADDWEVIRSELKARRAEWGEQEADREQKSNQTRVIIRPRLKDRLCGRLTPHFNAQAILRKGESTFMVSVTDGPEYKLLLIECVNEERIVRDEVPLEERVLLPRWRVLGDRDVLLAKTSMGLPVTFELHQKKLKEIKMPANLKSQAPIEAFSDPVRFNGQNLLVVGGQNRLLLLEALGDRWVQRDAENEDLERPTPPSHLDKLIAGDRLFYSAVFGSYFTIFELIGDKLKLVFKNKISDGRSLKLRYMPVAQVEDGRILFAFTFTFTVSDGVHAMNTRIIEFPLSKDPAKQFTYNQTVSFRQPGVRWLKGEKSVLLIPTEGGDNDSILMQKWDGQSLSPQQTIHLNDRNIGAVESFSYMDRLFVTYAWNFRELVILERINDVWAEVARVRIPNSIRGYKLIVDQDQVYAIVTEGKDTQCLIDLVYSQSPEPR